MNGALEMYAAAKKHGVKPILGCEVYVVDDRHARPVRSLRAQPPHAAGRRTTRATATSSSSPPRASSRGCTAASRRSTSSSWPATPRASSPSPAAWPPASPSACSTIARHDARAHADDLLQAFGARERLLRGPEERPRAPGQGQRGHGEDRPRGRPPARRHRRRPLPAPRGLPPPHGAALRADEVHAAEPEDDLRDQRVLPQELGGDGRARSPSGPRPSPPRSRSPSAATSSSRPATSSSRATRRRPASPRPTTCATSSFRGLAERYGNPLPADARERADLELGVIDRMGFSAYFLIVWDFVKYAKDNGVAVGPGRGSAAGSLVVLRAADHRRRPAALRPALRALPQPRARVHAGHRHRLLRARPRARRSAT